MRNVMAASLARAYVARMARCRSLSEPYDAGLSRMLIAYIATLHGRFTGKVRGLGTAVCAIVSFMLVILCYYGVNFLFGRGLHTYGFGSGEIWPVIAFFAFEGLLMGASAIVELRRRGETPDEGTPA